MRRELAQAFLRRRDGRAEALVVIELETGARERATIPLASDDLAAAARTLGRHLARSGMVHRARGVRLRVEGSAGLRDDGALAGELVAAFEAARREGSEA